MESASCSILNPLRFSSAIVSNHKKFYYQTQPRYSNNHHALYPGTLFSSTFPGNFDFPGKCLTANGFTAFCSPSGSTDQNPSPELAVLLEVDGVLIDAYRLGNLQAFNVAFKKLGLDCANWTKPVYLDLARRSGGDEEKMLILFFNRIGWPTSLPTSEKGSFIKKVLREKTNALGEFAMSESTPLRPGVEDFVDEASKTGIPVVILASYGNSDENIARSIVDKLGHGRISKIKIVGKEEVEQSLYGQLVLGKRVLSGVDDQLAKEAIKAASIQKKKIAEEVASKLKLSVAIDTTLSESLEKTVVALRAGAEYAGLPVKNCVLLAGSHSGVAGAAQIAMPCVVIRSSSTSRTEFPLANAIVDGFGGADLTIPKLLQKRW
ncbi:hypothetical protein Tsubulata_030590 [Turnera subulata]|uniref:Uncharacterized protein n=1 Tax=Turnera subulata TaxID=218843 RepID=A0A9Q0G9Q0_9ROSI|nr:hypothetical protein Tsubulata_030590 [Turnera subulata]